MVRLHVNVDHVATLRQARRGTAPDPVAWAVALQEAGADGITCHLRKDRRHIQDEDVRRLRQNVHTLLNLECSLDEEMVGIAIESGANEVCIVPENRQEITTEGGLDVLKEAPRVRRVVPLFARAGALVSLFVDPDLEALSTAADLGATFVELHTGFYANAQGYAKERELDRLRRAATFAAEIGLRVNAGHGLDYENVPPIARLPNLEELNIGHSIVSRALFAGVEGAVTDMLRLIGRAGGYA
jgi:pyridoxine 5-phosphate synthase